MMERAPLGIGISTVAWSAFWVLGITIVLSLWRSGRREEGLPPGPPTIPVFGNTLSLSISNRLVDYRLFQKWAEKYGPVMSLKLGNVTAIIFSDDGKASRELFEKKAEYNGRPLNPTSHIIGRGAHPIWNTDPYLWRYYRKWIVQHYNSSMSSRSSQIKIQEAESTQLLKDLIESTTTITPYSPNLSRFAFSVMASTAYGIRVPNCEYPLPHRHLSITRSWVSLSTTKGGGAPPVDIWPWLDYIVPQFLLPWKERCRKVSDRLFNLYAELSQIARTLDAQGVIDDTLAHKLLTMQPDQPKLTAERLDLILGVALEGGSDILASTLCTTILALLTHPDVQEKGRAEVDRLCDQDTIPSWTQVEKMQYVRSIGKESLRWRTPFPMGVPHALTEDDEYMGYKLPAGSIVTANIWGIHMNPSRYDEPEKFKPERFQNHTLFTGDYSGNPDYRAKDHYTFFPGRRMCPGVYIAEQAQMLIIAKLLWAFDIVPPPGISVSEVDNRHETAFIGTTFRTPKPFPMLLRPRSEHRVQVIQAEFTHLNNVFFPTLEHDIHIAGE